MSYLLSLKAHSDTRGNLVVIEKELGFDIKRVFYIYGVDAVATRGGHRHKKTKQGLIVVSGSCIVSVADDGYFLNDPSMCVVLEPEDFHTMHSFSKNCVLLVLASEYYDKEDYIYD